MATANQKKVRRVASRVKARNPSIKTNKAARSRAREIIQKRKGPAKVTLDDIPMSSEAKAARQALIASDLVGMMSDRDRTASIASGAFGSPHLRSAGGARERYRVGKPKADKGVTTNRKRKKQGAPIGKTKPGSAARRIKRAGGTRKDLTLFRRLGIQDRRRIMARARRGGNIKKITRSRFQR